MQSGRIDNAQWHTVNVQVFAQHVPSGPGARGNDCRIVSGQTIQQARFADIGRPGNH